MFNPDALIDNLCNSGFAIIDNFLPTTAYRDLQRMAQHHYQKGSFRPAKIGLKMNAQHNETIRKDEIFWLDEQQPNDAIQLYLQQISLLTKALNNTLFLCISEFESHFAIYQPGAFYKKHVDQFNHNNQRQISCVYYLNEKWSDIDGGDLKLYNLNNELLQNISPLGNRFICFKSDLPHEVTLTYQPRYSIAGWLKTKN